MGRKPRKYTQRRRSSSRPRASSNNRDCQRSGKRKSRVVTNREKEKSKRPKKALGPYMYYCKLNRKSVQLQNPNLSFGDIGRVLGSQWCGLDEKEKKKYIRKAQVDKRRYNRQMSQYVK